MTASLPLRLTAFLALLLMGVSPALAADILVQRPADFDAAVAKARPGDDIVLASGEWRDFQMRVVGRDITVRGQEPGRVWLTGRSNLRIAGSGIVVRDLGFRNGYSPTSEVISFRGASGEFANNSRVTNVVIDSFNKPDPADTDFWVVMYGKNNRFDHNHVVGKRNRGVTLAVRLHDARGRDNRHRIDHNYFGPRPKLGKNGGETIRIGTSQFAHTTSRTIVERNMFEATDGELEIVSVKSGGNIVRDNLFLRARGTLTLRHGDGNLVERNVFLGHGKPGTGGIRVINANQVVRDNYMEGLAGSGLSSALSLMNGARNSPAHKHAQVVNATIERNSVIDSARVTIGAGANGERQAAPERSVMRNNLLAGERLRVALDASPRGIATRGNVAIGGADSSWDGAVQARGSLVRARNGLLYPTGSGMEGVGAPRDLDPVTRGDVGPSWYR